ncbi:flagellin [Lachnospiraceae bacterium G11]|nr:flagellin [Lachnospiraceae bacterium G11]
MVVQHNLTAMNSNRMLGITTKTQAKATEKLSSGYKINRAADDAAGLSISEKMRKQIRGLTQASANAQDGISAVQTAEGALTEVHDMLQRMNEQAVKAANGTNSKDDRDYIQAEVDQLVTEIDRVATTTKFNETYLLKGTNGTDVGKLSFKDATKAVGLANDGSDKFDADGIAKVSTQVKQAADAGSDTHSTYSKTKVTVNSVDYYLIEDYTKGTNAGDKTLEEELAHLNTGETTPKYFSDASKLAEQIQRDNGASLKDVSVSYDSTEGNKLTAKLTAFSDLNKGLDVSLHVGADSTKDNKIDLTIEMMSARGLGVNGLKVYGDSFDNATNAIDTIKSAIQKVSEQRSALGAVQNRLEHTINNLDNVVENTTSAESAIRDTDMASQMVSYSNNNILAQAGQAMLAQANQSNQGVLSLLG